MRELKLSSARMTSPRATFASSVQMTFKVEEPRMGMGVNALPRSGKPAIQQRSSDTRTPHMTFIVRNALDLAPAPYNFKTLRII